jgi:hypothetical protein
MPPTNRRTGLLAGVLCNVEHIPARPQPHGSAVRSTSLGPRGEPIRHITSVKPR